jgi:hypothetical protein
MFNSSVQVDTLKSCVLIAVIDTTGKLFGSGLHFIEQIVKFLYVSLQINMLEVELVVTFIDGSGTA